MRYKITLSYNGLELNGWQRQDNAPSVQEELSRALSILAGCEVSVTGAGRTDARVNAVNYVAHFDASSLDGAKISCKLNAILPKNIVVHEITPADESFHARFSALSREYKYFIHKVKDPFVADFSYFRCEPLDVGKMNRACSALLGTHDFRCFEKTGSDNKTSVCTVYEAVWETYEPAHASLLGYPYREGDYLVFRIRADRFLRNMVRAIVGSLLDVGRGKQDEAWFAGLISSPDASSPTDSPAGSDPAPAPTSATNSPAGSDPAPAPTSNTNPTPAADSRAGSNPAPTIATVCPRSLAGSSVPAYALFLTSVTYPEE